MTIALETAANAQIVALQGQINSTNAAITEAEKAEWLKNEFYASRFTFQAVPGSDKAKAPEPIEAKSFQSKPKEEEK